MFTHDGPIFERPDLPESLRPDTLKSDYVLPHVHIDLFRPSGGYSDEIGRDPATGRYLRSGKLPEGIVDEPSFDFPPQDFNS